MITPIGALRSELQALDKRRDQVCRAIAILTESKVSYTPLGNYLKRGGPRGSGSRATVILKLLRSLSSPININDAIPLVAGVSDLESIDTSERNRWRMAFNHLIRSQQIILDYEDRVSVIPPKDKAQV